MRPYSNAFAPVISSLLETDLYKFTMWQAFLHQHPEAQAEYAFVCRSQPALPLSTLAAEVNAELDHLCSLQFTAAELAYLRGLRFLKPDFIDFLALFRFQRQFITAQADGDRLVIAVRGPQVHVTGFEIPVLAIVNELYMRRLPAATLTEARRRLTAKLALLRQEAGRTSRRHPFEFFDFGLRRRFSAAWHDEVVATLAHDVPEWFRGTSNVALARRHGVVPIGTMAHEFLQSFQAYGVRLRDFQKAALEAWVQEYRGDLGIALTDTVGMAAFVRDFDLYFAKLFDGLRHDSGDPYAWGTQALAAYRVHRIDPHGKRLVFSDGLDLPRALALWRHFGDEVATGFGIGTNLTNDTGLSALNIVLKLVRCNGQPVAKLSDTPGKTLCSDAAYLAYLRQVFAEPTAESGI